LRLGRCVWGVATGALGRSGWGVATGALRLGDATAVGDRATALTADGNGASWLRRDLLSALRL